MLKLLDGEEEIKRKLKEELATKRDLELVEQ